MQGETGRTHNGKKEELTIKRMFTLKHYIVMLLLSYETRTAQFAIGPSIVQIQKLLRDKFGMQRTRGRIGEVLTELRTAGIIRKEARSSVVPEDIAPKEAGCYHVVDTEQPFMDIQEVYERLHRYEDRDRHRKHRQAKRDKKALENKTQGRFKVVKYHGTKTI